MSTTRDYIAIVDRLRQVINRGPMPAETGNVTARARRGLRTAVLRVLKPYTAYQDEVNTTILSSLGELEHRSRRLERLEDLADDLIGAVESLRRRTAPVETIGAELHAVPYVADRAFDRFESPVGEVTGYRTLAADINGSSPYAAFEDLFRGPAERVTELQRPYLALVADHQPVLDVGCGRGEFLALLAAEGVEARGVDSDPGMIARCQARGLNATLGDANDHLESVEDRTLGTVFCAQVIEHLPVNDLRRLIDVSLRKLKPGGLFIAETVNPHSIPALKTFWVDLTHQHPVFPEVALGLCAIAGFCPAYVFAPGHASYELAKFESTSYAVVASAPAPAAAQTTAA